MTRRTLPVSTKDAIFVARAGPKLIIMCGICLFGAVMFVFGILIGIEGLFEENSPVFALSVIIFSVLFCVMFSGVFYRAAFDIMRGDLLVLFPDALWDLRTMEKPIAIAEINALRAIYNNSQMLAVTIVTKNDYNIKQSRFRFGCLLGFEKNNVIASIYGLDLSEKEIVSAIQTLALEYAVPFDLSRSRRLRI